MDLCFNLRCFCHPFFGYSSSPLDFLVTPGNVLYRLITRRNPKKATGLDLLPSTSSERSHLKGFDPLPLTSSHSLHFTAWLHFRTNYKTDHQMAAPIVSQDQVVEKNLIIKTFPHLPCDRHRP